MKSDSAPRPQVDGIVPIGEAKQRQPVGPQVAVGESQGAAQVIQHTAAFQRAPGFILLVIGDPLFEKRPVAGFL